MTEAQLKRDIVRQLLKEGGYARRLEDKYAIGTLDLLLVTARHVIYAEAKLLTGIVALPARVQQREQIRLFNEAGNPCARALVIAYKEGFIGCGLPGERWDKHFAVKWPLPPDYILGEVLDGFVDLIFAKEPA